MAIQLPDPGQGDGKTGDNEYVMWTKTRDNFSDTTHAASRLVGEATGNVMEVGAYGWGAMSVDELDESEAKNPAAMRTGMYFYPVEKAQELHPEGVESAWGDRSCFILKRQNSNAGFAFWFPYHNQSKNNIYLQSFSGTAKITHKFYTDKNTTKEAETGYLVASSPVLKMQHDSFEKVHEAEQLDIEANNTETGVYEITGTTGLREGDGWNLKPPKDVNGNVLCICEASEKNGVITLKTYKKKFDFETVSIVADYEQPTDIPEGATVMLRFNDLPKEQLDELIE